MLKKIGLVFFVFSLVGALYYCEQQRISDERDFVEYGLLREGAIYTLLGEKPISQFGAFSHEKVSDIEIESLINECRVKLDKSKLLFTEKDYFKKDIRILWETWKSRQKLNSKSFALVGHSNQNITFIHLVNKSMLKKVLEENHELLSNFFQMELDIGKILAEIEDPKSFLWTHMMNYEYGHLSMGLLYGFGRENSCIFQQYCDENVTMKGKSSSLEGWEDSFNRFYCTNISLDNLILPVFITYHDNDPVLEHYKEERARIRREYKDVDLRQLFIDAFK
ncbi:hypothetical protein K0U07_03260 [bacterium]|nr:hypothetical protein [bacterium]